MPRKHKFIKIDLKLDAKNPLMPENELVAMGSKQHSVEIEDTFEKKDLKIDRNLT